jgi:hypothetical protein
VTPAIGARIVAGRMLKSRILISGGNIFVNLCQREQAVLRLFRKPSNSTHHHIEGYAQRAKNQ